MKKEKMSIVALVLALLMVLNLSACGNAQNPVEDSPPDNEIKETVTDVQKENEIVAVEGYVTNPLDATVKIGTKYEWNNMNPYGPINNGRSTCGRYVFEYLFDRAADGTLLSCIGKTATDVDEVTTEVEIYDYVRDSAGNHITANDVVYSMNTYISSGHFFNAAYVQNIEVVSDYVIRITLKTPAAGVMTSILSMIPIVSETAYEASGNGMTENPIGTGPYVVTNYISGSELDMTVNEDYWQTDELCATLSHRNIKNVVFVTITEPAQMTIALQTGAIHVAQDIDASELYLFEKGGDYADNFNLRKYTARLLRVLCYNCEESNVFNNKLLRQAVSYAIDTDVILKTTYNGNGVTLKTFGSDAYADWKAEWNDVDYYSYNKEKALDLLAQAGYPNGEGLPKLRIMSNNTAAYKSVMQIIAAQLADVGIEVEVLAYETALFDTYKNGHEEWDMMVDNFVTQITNAQFWTQRFNEDKYAWGGTYCHGVGDDQLKALVDAANNTNTASSETTQALKDYIDEDIQIYGLVSNNVNHVTVPTISELVLSTERYVIAGACSYDGFTG